MTAALLSLLIIPLWAYSDSVVPLAIGAFLLQVMVQGAWGVIPAHLNELSPEEARGTFPGFVYQLGNFIASSNAPLQGWIAFQFGGRYSVALAAVVGVVAVVIAIVVAFGPEAKGVSMTGAARAPAPAE
jgi:SHS family lactate transporter-like MFS transporter